MRGSIAMFRRSIMFGVVRVVILCSRHHLDVKKNDRQTAVDLCKRLWRKSRTRDYNIHIISNELQYPTIVSNVEREGVIKRVGNKLSFKATAVIHES